MQAEYLTNLMASPTNAGLDGKAVEVSEDLRDLRAGQGIFEMGIRMVNTDKVLN